MFVWENEVLTSFLYLHLKTNIIAVSHVLLKAGLAEVVSCDPARLSSDLIEIANQKGIIFKQQLPECCFLVLIAFHAQILAPAEYFIVIELSIFLKLLILKRVAPAFTIERGTI